MMSRKHQSADPDQELRDAFNVFDRDGTGTISRDELRNVMKSIGEHLTEDELDEMLKLADENGDGQIDCKSSSFRYLHPYTANQAHSVRRGIRQDHGPWRPLSRSCLTRLSFDGFFSSCHYPPPHRSPSRPVFIFSIYFLDEAQGMKI
jgi:hypothetical protein